MIFKETNPPPCGLAVVDWSFFMRIRIVVGDDHEKTNLG